MIKFLTSLFTGDEGSSDNNSVSTPIKNVDLSGFSYLFKKKRLEFDDQFSFTIHYLYKNEVWLAANAFAAGVGYEDAKKAIDRLVDHKYKQSVNRLVFDRDSGDDDDDDGSICINKHGVLQLLDHIEFDNKAEFTAWLFQKVYHELEGKFVPSPIDEKLTKVLAAVDGIKLHNDEMARIGENFKSQVIERFELFDRRIAELNEKMTVYDNVDELYKRLRDHHASTATTHLRRRPSFLSGTSESSATAAAPSAHHNDLSRYETVRFPRDTSKHPRLSVYVKPAENGTRVAFLASQQRRHATLKRKYTDMEMIYDSVHPNPQLAMHCINEELDSKNFDYSKQSRRSLHINCSVDTVKSFIHETL